jgi:hypothetical protein
VRVGRADARHRALADAGDDGLLTGTTDEAVDVGPHGDPGDGHHLDAVLGDRRDARRVDHLRVDAHLHGFEHVATGEVDRGGPLPRQFDVGAVGRDEGVDHPLDVAAGEVVRLHLADVEIDLGLRGADERSDDRRRRHLAQPHADQRADADLHPREDRGDPQPDRDEVEEHDQHQQHGCGDDDQSSGSEVHGRP